MRPFNKAHILKMVAHVARRSRGVPDKRLMHPRREWLIGLCLFALILGIGSVLSALSYSFYLTVDSSSAVAESTSVPRYNQAAVENALELFAVRERRYNSLQGVVTPPPPATTTEATGDEAGNDSVTIIIADTFPEKLVYGANSETVSETDLIAHCTNAGGTFNQCGSVCPATAEVCDAQCAFTCEFTGPDALEAEPEPVVETGPDAVVDDVVTDDPDDADDPEVTEEEDAGPQLTF